MEISGPGMRMAAAALIVLLMDRQRLTGTAGLFVRVSRAILPDWMSGMRVRLPWGVAVVEVVPGVSSLFEVIGVSGWKGGRG